MHFVRDSDVCCDSIIIITLFNMHMIIMIDGIDAQHDIRHVI